MLQTFLHRGLNLLCGGVAEYPRAVRAELGFVCVNGGFCFMVNGAHGIDAAFRAGFLCCGNGHIVLVSQFLYIML